MTRLREVSPGTLVFIPVWHDGELYRVTSEPSAQQDCIRVVAESNGWTYDIPWSEPVVICENVALLQSVAHQWRNRPVEKR